MTDTGPATAVSLIRTAMSRTGDPRSDGQLLVAYRDHREPDAFTALVYRHGPRVWAVCQRITRHAHDADDAFQAVFLVLARRAADIRPPDSLGAWLYGVAYLTAQDARSMAARRRSRQTPTADLPEVPVETAPADSELAAALDAEIASLPEHYRAAVVLCELDGLARREAAKRLGIAEGTLSSRLAEGRKRLASGLKRKGYTFSAALAAASVPSVASGSPTVFSQACQLGHLAAAGDKLPLGAPVALAERIGKIMFLQQLKLMTVVVACGLLLLVGGLIGFSAADDESTLPQAPATKPAEVRPVAAKPVNKMTLLKQNKAVLMDADGKNEKVLFDLAKGEAIHDPHLSPDGKTLAYLTQTFEIGKPIEVDFNLHYSVAFRELGAQKPTVLNVKGTSIAWSSNGKELLVIHAPDGGEGPRSAILKATTSVIDVATKKETSVTLPDGHFAEGFTPDGRNFVTMFADNTGKKIVMSTCFVSRDGKDVKTVSDPDYATVSPRLSPDGKTLLFVGLKLPDGIGIPEKPIEQLPKLFVQPIGGKVSELPDVPLNGQVQGFCWSPDGKKIAYSWRQVLTDKVEPGKPDDRETESHLCVCDADGKNHKTLLTEKGQGAFLITLSSVDWR